MAGCVHSALPNHSQSGFTLIELVTVMVLLGILAAYVVPRFTGRDIFDEAAAQNQLIAGLRIAQQRAMYDRANCYRLSIDNAVIWVEQADNPLAPVNWAVIGPADWRDGVAIDVPVSNQTVIFDGLGNRALACGGAPVSGGSVLTMALGGVAVCVNGVGYVYAC